MSEQDRVRAAAQRLYEVKRAAELAQVDQVNARISRLRHRLSGGETEHADYISVMPTPDAGLPREP